jgi:cell division protein FtsX
MDAATIMVIVLTAGGVALLVWFEINSRRNEAKQRQMSGSARLELDPSRKKDPGKVESEKSRANIA